jgi:hypothetical protein
MGDVILQLGYLILTLFSVVESKPMTCQIQDQVTYEIRDCSADEHRAWDALRAKSLEASREDRMRAVPTSRISGER